MKKKNYGIESIGYHLIMIAVSLFILFVCVFFNSCAQNRIRKPKNETEAKNIIANLQAQFPTVIKKDSTTKTDSTTENISKSFIIKSKDSTQLLKQTIDSLFNELQKDCPQIENIKYIYRNKIIEKCNEEEKIRSYSFDSAGFKFKLRYDSYGNLWGNLQVPKKTITKTTEINTTNPIYTKKYYEEILDVWEIILILLLFFISSLIILRIKDYRVSDK